MAKFLIAAAVAFSVVACADPETKVLVIPNEPVTIIVQPTPTPPQCPTPTPKPKKEEKDCHS